MTRFREEWHRARDGEPFDGCRAALGTATAEGVPSVRYVLVKEFDDSGFWVFTNYGSPKARSMEENPFAAMVWHWASTGVQVRIEGRVRRASGAESDAYFEGRPRESQLGAWASRQSEVMPKADALRARLEEVRTRFGGGPVPRPDFWGGFVVEPNRFEFWREGDARLHDRWLYRRTEDGDWSESRLYP